MKAITWVVPILLIGVIIMAIAAAALPKFYIGKVDMTFEEDGKEVTLNMEYDVGLFRGCFRSISSNVSYNFDECFNIKPDCKFDIEMEGEDADTPLPACTEFNAGRGFLVLGILFSAFSIIVISYTIYKRTTPSKRTLRYLVSLTFITVTTFFFMFSFIAGAVHYKKNLDEFEKMIEESGEYIVNDHSESLSVAFALNVCSFVFALLLTAVFGHFGRTKDEATNVDYAYMQY